MPQHLRIEVDGEVRSLDQSISEAAARAWLIDQATRLTQREPIRSHALPPPSPTGSRDLPPLEEPIQNPKAPTANDFQVPPTSPSNV